MKRKLPPNDILKPLIRLGFHYYDIADRFDVTVQAVSRRAERMGFPPLDPHVTRALVNGAPPASRYFG